MAKLDIDKLSKQMPYSVPEGFFDKLEDDILVRIKAEREAKAEIPSAPKQEYQFLRIPKQNRIVNLGWSAVAAVASIAIILVAYNSIPTSKTTARNLNEQEAFNLLSNNDKEELIYVYQNDIFLQ